MRFTELDPQLIVRTGDGFRFTGHIVEADGVIFRCPACKLNSEAGQPGGVHSIICWQPHVPPDVDPKPGRWSITATSFEDMTLTGNPSSSVLLTSAACKAHFTIANGVVVCNMTDPAW